MTEVLYWTGGNKAPSVGPAGACFFNHHLPSRSLWLLLFGFAPDFILLENKLIKRTFNIKCTCLKNSLNVSLYSGEMKLFQLFFAAFTGAGLPRRPLLPRLGLNSSSVHLRLRPRL